MRPEFSEFSYGFALTNELIYALGTALSAAPVFPSLIAEGQPGGGWDVRIDQRGVPMFIQFKLCHCMTRRNCLEARYAGFNVPCYRMHLRPARVSPQHEMLLDLESEGQEVYYAAPGFHTSGELNAAFLGKSVGSRSIWIRPSDIGPLPDDRGHHVSFERGSPWTFFSEPRHLEAKREFGEVVEGLFIRLRERGEFELTPRYLEGLAHSISEIVAKHEQMHFVEERADWLERLRSVSPLQRVAFYASIFLESQLFIVQEQRVAL